MPLKNEDTQTFSILKFLVFLVLWSGFVLELFFFFLDFELIENYFETLLQNYSSGERYLFG